VLSVGGIWAGGGSRDDVIDDAPEGPGVLMDGKGPGIPPVTAPMGGGGSVDELERLLGVTMGSSLGCGRNPGCGNANEELRDCPKCGKEEEALSPLDARVTDGAGTVKPCMCTGC